MRITVEIPEDTAARMLSDEADAARSLLELAGYTACVNGRISEYEYMRLLGLESRFDLRAVMKRIQMEGEAQDAEFLSQELAALAPAVERPIAKAR